MPRFNEDTVELAALEWLRDIGYDYIHGGDIAPEEPAAERTTYAEVLLIGRLRAALERLNPHIPSPVRPAIVDEVIAVNAKNVAEFKAGNEKALNALVGQIMKASKGKANPQQVNDLLRQKLA